MDDLPLPREIRNAIAEFFVVRLQRWWRQRLKDSKYRGCDDCGARCTTLILYPACEDFQIAGRLCCTKNVCVEGCVYFCPNRHPNHLYSDDGYIYRTSRRCSISMCDETVYVHFRWVGDMTPEEMRRRI